MEVKLKKGRNGHERTKDGHLIIVATQVDSKGLISTVETAVDEAAIHNDLAQRFQALKEAKDRVRKIEEEIEARRLIIDELRAASKSAS